MLNISVYIQTFLHIVAWKFRIYKRKKVLFVHIDLEEKRRGVQPTFHNTVKLGNKERFDKEQIGIKEPFPVTKCQFTSYG